METVLYSYWRSSASWRVRIALNLKEIPYRYEAVNLITRMNATADFTKKNPMSQVPSLLIDGKNLSQSLAIIRYLELTRTQTRLTPQDPYLEAKMWEISEIINSGIQPLQNLPVLYKIEQLGGNKKDWLKDVVARGLTAVEAVLAETAGKFAFGDIPTIADACIIPQLYAARRFGVAFGSYPLLSRVETSAQEHPAFVKADPSNQPDAEQPSSAKA